MGVLSFLFGSRSKSPPLSAGGQSSDSQPLRLAIGPSPWAFGGRSIVISGVTYRFRETAPGDNKLPGMTSLQDANGTTLVVLGFYCYARILDDGTVLLWRESGEKAERRIIFDCFRLSDLRPVSDPLATASEILEKKLGSAPLPESQHWEFSPRLEAGIHSLSVPHDWSRFEETLVLSDYADADGYEKEARAIFVFNWSKRQVEVFPQDWFNTGDYDFGYQWITRVARRSDGSIVGDGIRLGSFELDETNRRVKKWLNQDPFYMIQEAHPMMPNPVQQGTTAISFPLIGKGAKREGQRSG